MQPVTYLEVPSCFAIISAFSSHHYLHFSFCGLCSVLSAKHKHILTVSVTKFTQLQLPSNVQIESSSNFWFKILPYLSHTQVSLLFSHNFQTCCYSMILKDKKQIKYHKQQREFSLKYKSMRSGKAIYHQNGSWQLTCIYLALF